MGLTSDLCGELWELRSLDAEDLRQLRELILDFFAAAFAGYRQNRAVNGVLEKVILPQGGAEESVVFRQGRRYPAGKAAFLNSAYGHGAELDDGNKRAAGHGGVHLIPAVFAMADRLGSTQDAVLLALAAGYEAYIRISSAAQPGLVARGFHSTGMAGTLACAAACAKLAGLDARGVEDALALATTMSGGLLSYGDSRPAIKPLNPAKAAENGVFAALLAMEGLRGPAEALEGPHGWFHAVTDEFDPACLRGSGRLLMHDCYFKLYPSCRHTHCGIDAAVALRGRLSPAEVRGIREVRVYIYPNAIQLAGIRIPKDGDDTKFSICYTLARALLTGSYGVEDMDPPKLTEDTLRLIDRIRLIPDETMEDRRRGVRGTRVEVVLESGEVLRDTVLVPRGDPENPLEPGTVLRKLRACAEGQAEAPVLEALAAAVGALGGEERFVNPMTLLC